MSPSRPIRFVVSTVGVLAVTAGLVTAPAHAAPTEAPAPTGSVTAITDRIAARLASEFADEARRAGLLSATSTHAVPLARAAGDTALGRAVREADRAVLAAKGLTQDGTSLLTIRLAHADMAAALRRGTEPLVASSPTDDAATTVTAYDLAGRRVALAADRVPLRPVYLIEVDTATALAKGAEVLRSTLSQRGLSPASVAPASGYWATQLKSIRLEDDKEPWHKGDAEIFTITAGFGLDGKVKVDTVQLPYLDEDGKTYYPNQLLVHFSEYKYNLADIVMMEEDGGTNYRDLALALTQALLTIVDGGAYIPLVNAIINALPDDWWTDDPDYVDSWYTLSTATGGTLRGAAGNGTMTVAPYWVAPL
ncbi:MULTISPECIES: DUF3103 family protein [unclassified Saccharothrix]|uniref:DUF3103 family protein n=1 Tax=unclassified Saccharothrix TaxID=2593673 RepID=UPI00307D0A02